MDVFGFITWLIQFLESIGLCISPNLGNFSATISSNTLSALLSLSSSSGTPMLWMLDLLLLSRGPWSTVHFFSLFSLYCSQWVDSIVLFPCSIILPSLVSGILLRVHSNAFVSVIINFQFFNFYLVLFYKFSLFSEIFYFLFMSEEFVIDWWTIYMVTVFKWLSDNSNIWFILVLVSVDFFSHLICEFSWFLVQWLIFKLHPGYFVYYVIRLWVLIRSSILAGSHPVKLLTWVLATFTGCASNGTLIFSLWDVILVCLIYLVLLGLALAL